MPPIFIRDDAELYLAGDPPPGGRLIDAPVWRWGPAGTGPKQWLPCPPDIWEINDGDDWSDSFGFHTLDPNHVAVRWPEAVDNLPPELGYTFGPKVA